MGDLILRLLLMLPLVGGLAVASLWLWRQTRLGGGGIGRERRLAVIDSLMLGPGNRLLVVEFDGRALLLAASRQGITLLSQTDIVDA